MRGDFAKNENRFSSSRRKRAGRTRGPVGLSCLRRSRTDRAFIFLAVKKNVALDRPGMTEISDKDCSEPRLTYPIARARDDRCFDENAYLLKATSTTLGRGSPLRASKRPRDRGVKVLTNSQQVCNVLFLFDRTRTTTLGHACEHTRTYIHTRSPPASEPKGTWYIIKQKAFSS